MKQNYKLAKLEDILKPAIYIYQLELKFKYEIMMISIRQIILGSLISEARGSQPFMSTAHVCISANRKILKPPTGSTVTVFYKVEK